MANKKNDSDPVVDKFREQHGNVAAFKSGGKLFVFRPLDLDEYEDFTARVRKTDNPGAVNRECCQTALLHPTLEELQTAFQRMPGFASVASQAIVMMAMVDIEVVAKKD